MYRKEYSTGIIATPKSHGFGSDPVWRLMYTQQATRILPLASLLLHLEKNYERALKTGSMLGSSEEHSRYGGATDEPDNGGLKILSKVFIASIVVAATYFRAQLFFSCGPPSVPIISRCYSQHNEID